MRDPVALHADGGVLEQGVLCAALAEERAVALAHHDRHEVDGHFGEQPQFVALSGDGATGDRDDAIASERLCMNERGRDTGGHEGERCRGVCTDPVGGDPVRHNNDGDVERVGPCQPSATWKG